MIIPAVGVEAHNHLQPEVVVVVDKCSVSGRHSVGEEGVDKLEEGVGRIEVGVDSLVEEWERSC